MLVHSGGASGTMQGVAEVVEDVGFPRDFSRLFGWGAMGRQDMRWGLWRGMAVNFKLVPTLPREGADAMG